MARKLFLACGIVSSALYIGRDLAAYLSYPGYDFVNQVISELSAIGVASRDVDITIGRVYAALMFLFSLGIWLSAGRDRKLRIAGLLLAAGTIFGVFWPPMHMRGQPMAFTDTLHIAWTAVWFGVSVTAMAFSAASLGKRFTYYTIATVALILAFGTLTGIQGVNLAANLPTPGIGIYERINIGAFLLWIVVLAFELWRGRSAAAERANA